MIIKNILNKVYFHPLFIISVFLFILLGKFRFICYFMLLIIVHELGHIFISLIFKWKIDKIIILPFGGLTKYNVNINTPLIEEFLVAISGILFQFIFYILVHDFINYKYFNLINMFIIFFNLLPIYPLDGSKIINVLLNILTNFKNSLLYTIILSYMFLVISILLCYRINKIIITVLVFLLLEVNKLYKKRYEIFNKFLLERYLKKIDFHHKKIINNIYSMKKGYKHIFCINNKYYTEKNYLSKIFSK